MLIVILTCRDKEEERGRDGRQIADIDTRGLGLIQEGCQTTGYETQIRQDCTKVIEKVCNNVTIAKVNKKIEKKCSTRVGMFELICNLHSNLCSD